MNLTDKTHDILDHIDPALIELADTPARRAMPRLAKAALIAACLCIALVGGAFAAQAVWGIPIFTPMDTSPVDGSPISGFTTVIQQEDGQPSAGPVKHPVDSYSQTLLDAAARLGSQISSHKSFTIWAQAEEFVGFALLENAMLAQADPLPAILIMDAQIVTDTPFSVSYTAIDGVLTSATAEGSYSLDTGTSAAVLLGLSVRTYTDHSPISHDDMFPAFGFSADCTITSESYTSPGGLTAAIITVCHPDQFTGYYAQFVLNGNAVTLHSVCREDNDLALSTLKEVLDAME